MFMAEKSNLSTIISSPTPVARQREPATLVAILSRGRVIIGSPAHNTSVPVVWPLHSGLFIQQWWSQEFCDEKQSNEQKYLS